MIPSSIPNQPTDNKHRPHALLKIDLWLVAVLICYVIFASTNWGKLETPNIDIGREVEISARLLTGQVLYRDIATYYAPLAYYVNALALLVFGQKLEVFYVIGLGLALAATLLFYRLAKRLICPSWAAMCTICMLIYCAIGPDIFHFVVPYSYGASYAMVLSLVAITSVDFYTNTGRPRWLVAGAIASGLAGLAKQEYGVAMLFSVLVGVNLFLVPNLQTRIRNSILVIFLAFATAFIPLALLAQQASWEKLSLSLFPASQLGLMNQNSAFQVSPLKTILTWWDSFRFFFISTLLITPSIIASHWLFKQTKLRSIPQRLLTGAEVITGFVLTTICFLGFFFIVKKFFPNFTQDVGLLPADVFQPLREMSWFIPFMVGWFALYRPKFRQYKHTPLLWTLLAFSLLLNSRWLFYINFYGLFAPPVVLLFFVILYHLTQPIRRFVWCYLLICLLFAGSIKVGRLTEYQYTVNSSHGSIYTRSLELARAFEQTIKVINVSKVTSVLVLPEGNILNFLSGTHSPSRELTFLPLTLPTTVDEQNFLSQMQANPPELIVYVDRSFPQWGYQKYSEFNPLVDQWITAQHRLIHVFPKDEGAINIYKS
ncbi:hypothetical protein G7B40_032220 [Aetokthonos hydrillicola Thurmond2011]|jgi:hypothetical protein|uniref:Glycosyltransferase RgtA/B/C/D-like domain-containing protein n=1 Tax=Aetokthonos hydrillicola Thurmond2011 TaxID=2712845 RepID=A0AAP5MDD8_9CYAN|nr:hypothetical protein [Aetokthonos hydrillicola]MBO3462946.1 hypothetical protein [Aetokthonos hydrillicola CCALA 1050]MBW4585690.1 hypothetical protein [Aetokthonos hydrillicola CCALA 1050]MDR9899194.1 hypothetical protein [Aetokthonos hydrillicola Thurmond2011]